MQFVPSMFLLRGQPVAQPRPVTLRCGVPADLPPLKYWRERIKLHGRGMLYPVRTARWLELLNSHPLLGELVACCPRVLYKIYRPYMTMRLGMDARIAALGWHYDFVLQRGFEQLSGQAARGGALLACVEGKSGLGYSLTLEAGPYLEREGELVINLCQDGTVVYSVAFSFCPEGIAIGCIQGPNRGDPRGAIRTATRELHGMRPKQLLVTLLRHLGHALGCARLRLTGNANRVVASAIRQGKVCADYDQLWREMGAIPQDDGDFTLACTAPDDEAELDDVPSKRRAEVRRRHAIVTQLAAAMAARFGAQ